MEAREVGAAEELQTEAQVENSRSLGCGQSPRWERSPASRFGLVADDRIAVFAPVGGELLPIGLPNRFEMRAEVDRIRS